MNAPLVHFITNYVTVNDMANTTLAFGGKPLMAEEIDELEDITSIANVLVINTGTITRRTLASMKKACQVANSKNIPIILDPVGVSASAFRKAVCTELLEDYHFAVIKGNLAEIKTLVDLSSESLGIDSLEEIKDNTPYIAKKCSETFNCITCITGSTDIIASRDRYALIRCGTEKLTLITGTGCMIAAIIAVYHGMGHSAFDASIYGIGAMSLSGVLAESELLPLEGLGTYKVKLFDHFTNMTPNKIEIEGMIERYEF